MVIHRPPKPAILVRVQGAQFEEDKKMIFYLCDGKKEDCTKQSCYKKGGPCRHTADERHRRRDVEAQMVEVGKDKWELDRKGIRQLFEGMCKKRC